MNVINRFKWAKEIYDEFITSQVYVFSSFTPSMIQNKTPGVYAIHINDTKETLYVGKTTNLRQRLYYNHLMGPLNNARLKKYLIDDKEHFPNIRDIASAKQWIKANCSFQFIIVKDYRKRGHVEGLMSYLLNVKYVDKEH